MKQVDPRFQKLYDMAVKELTEDILPFWMEHDVDEKYGGFYGNADNQGNPIEEGPKCLILNARLVWTFASAYRILGEKKYLKMAKRAYDYFCAHFLDAEHGGAYFMLSYKGEPIDDKKFVYGQAFSIYALAEYARATGEKEAVDKAIAIYELLEKHAFDPDNLGYFEQYSRDWSQDLTRQRTNISLGGETTKTMNTHLHLIEAYTGLLRVWRTPEMEAKVRQHLDVMLDKIVNQAIGHYWMFLTTQWDKTSNDISFGHDIEGTWLMMETCEVLGQKDAEQKAAPICLKMAAACLDESIAEDGSMLYEYKPDTGEMERGRSWWVQAESVVGFLNAWQLSGEERFLDASLKGFAYIDKYVVDHEYGEWFAMVGDDGKPLAQGKDALKIEGWKCPYHNARMCFEIIERYRKATAE